VEKTRTRYTGRFGTKGLQATGVEQKDYLRLRRLRGTVQTRQRAERGDRKIAARVGKKKGDLGRRENKMMSWEGQVLVSWIRSVKCWLKDRSKEVKGNRLPY